MLIDKNNYTNILVDILFRRYDNKIHPHSLFMQELVRYSTVNGMIDRNVIRPILRDNLKLNDESIRKTINILKKKGHIREIIGVTICLHPNYLIAKRCDRANGGDGFFVISPIG